MLHLLINYGPALLVILVLKLFVEPRVLPPMLRWAKNKSAARLARREERAGGRPSS